MGQYKYWTGVRFVTTTNSQIPLAAPVTAQRLATRSNEDEYIRSIWWAELSYRSDGISPPIDGWWSAASVRLVIQWDPLGAVAPHDINFPTPDHLGFADLQPRYTRISDAGGYVVQYESPPQGVVLKTARKPFDLTHRPGVLASLWYFDQNAAWSRIVEPTAQVRARISGRVLWSTDVPPV